MKTVSSIAEAHADHAALAVSAQAMGAGVRDLIVDADPFYKSNAYVYDLGEKELLAAADRLVKDGALRYFELGGVLARIKETRVYRDAGFQTFQAYIEQHHHMKVSAASQAMAMYRTLSTNGIPYEKVKSLSWSVLRAVAPALKPATVDAQVKKFSHMTVDEVLKVEEVKQSKNPNKRGAGERGGRARADNLTASGSRRGKKATPADSAAKYLKEIGAPQAVELLLRLFNPEDVQLALTIQMHALREAAAVKPGTKPGKATKTLAEPAQPAAATA